MAIELRHLSTAARLGEAVNSLQRGLRTVFPRSSVWQWPQLQSKAMEGKGYKVLTLVMKHRLASRISF